MRRWPVALFLALTTLPAAAPATAEGLPQRKIQMDGRWGALEIGQTDGARRRLVVTGPPGAAIGDLGAKLAYYAPQVLGVEVGASYTPVPRGSAATPDPRKARHMVEAAAKKKLRMGKVRAKVTAGTSRTHVRADSRRVPKQSWIVGAQVAWNAVRVEGGVREQYGADGTGFRSWSSNVTYLAGSWQLDVRMQRVRDGDEPAVSTLSADASIDLTPRWRLSADIGRTQVAEDAHTTVSLNAKLVF
ncbi:MAG TPA: porin [Azospirillum sp.]|nr:porin [Azospirillum sp.]